ncbi:hypothetical protein FK545_17055 [Planococcus glaciei]|nr:hypothetical protein FK545_17055 [Planococcus glaciei]
MSLSWHSLFNGIKKHTHPDKGTSVFWTRGSTQLPISVCMQLLMALFRLYRSFCGTGYCSFHLYGSEAVK